MYAIRKIIAIIVIIAIFISIAPSSVEGAISATKNNSYERNLVILNTLKNILGSDVQAEEALSRMLELGLISETGELITYEIEIDGKIMSLEKVRELISSDAFEPEKLITVDGAPLSLKDLKLMLEIEDELKRIKDTYFNEGITLNDEQRQSLASLRQQIQTEGISMFSAADSSIEFPSGIDHGIYAEVETDLVVFENGSGNKSLKVTLKDSKGNKLAKVPNYNISIAYRFVEGSAKKEWYDSYYFNEEYFSERNGNFTGNDGVIYFNAGATETEKPISFTIIDDKSHYEGNKSFVIQLYNPQNIQFANGKIFEEKQINIHKTFKWPTQSEVTFTGTIQPSVGVGDITNIKSFLVNDTVLALLEKAGIYTDIEFSVLKNVNAGAFSDVEAYLQLGTEYPETYGVNRFKFSMPVYQNYTSYSTNLKLAKDSARYMRNAFFPEEPGEEQWLHGGYVKLETSPPGSVFGYFTIKFCDKKAPSIISANIPTGMKFTYPQSVPITVEYSEPVKLNNVQIKVNGMTLKPIELTSISKYATFLYPVQLMDQTYLNITEITSAVDMAGYVQSNSYSQRFDDIIQNSVKYYSFSNPIVTTTNVDGKQTGRVSIDIVKDPMYPNLTAWLESEAVNYPDSNGRFRVPSIYASIDGGKTKIDLYVDDADNPGKLLGEFTSMVNAAETDVTRAVEFYLDPHMGSNTNHRLIIGKFAEYIVPAPVFLENGDIIVNDTYPENGVVFAEDLDPLVLTYTIHKPGATWSKPEDFQWTILSGDESVASINNKGVVIPTGKPGSVTFGLIAKNGNVEGRAITVAARPLTIKVGLTPFINIPSSANVISIVDGDSAEVRWISNLIAKNDELKKGATFKIKMFSAEYTEGTVNKGALIYDASVTGTITDPVSSHSIPSTFLNGVSVLGKYSYIVEVSGENPYKTGQQLVATAYINIESRPVSIKLQKLESYYITDATKNLTVNWEINNLDTVNGSEFEFTVTDNNGNIVLFNQTVTESSGGSHNFVVPGVASGFRDTYTFAVKAKNNLDATWSYDSFVLYVYSHNSLKILIDGTEVPNKYHVMSNIDRIKSMTSEQILALKRDIYLKNVISINFGEHAWGKIRDQISWKSSDSKVASINFKEQNLYENIESYLYTSYRPETEFVLSGLNNGSSRITAVHATTGLTKTIDVKVDTLKDKLYLFQISPMAETSLTYINGEGISRSVKTNANGELALYEESGIKSEIYMKSTIGDQVYLGTIYKDLVSSERDWTRLELYPLNIIKLNKVSTAELYFKKPDGTPYSGDVILRGGVYKNGEYCSSALLNNKDGKEDQIIKVDSSGKFKVQMDSMQFWVNSNDEVLSGSEKISYIFEVRFPGDEYFPRLLNIKAGNDETRSGNSVVRVEEVPEGEEFKPFIVVQDVDFGFENEKLIDVRKFNGKIGPGQTSDKINLITTMFWWGEDTTNLKDKHSLVFEDQYGVIPALQKNESIFYPFSTIKATRNTFTISEYSLSGWIERKYSRGMKLIINDAEGNQYMKKTMPFRIINMLGTKNVEETDDLSFLLETMSSGFGAEAGSFNIGDALIGEGLSYLSTIGTGDTQDKRLFSMHVSPTLDPTVFTAFIQVNAGNMEDDNVTGVYSDNSLDSDFDYSPSLFDVLDMQEGKYLENQKKKRDENPKNGKSKANRDISFTLGGFMEAEIIYNYEKEKWEIFILNGGFIAGGGVSYNWIYNTIVGFVPVTAQFAVGGTAEVIFKAAIQRGEEIRAKYDKDSVNDYLTTLRLYTYIKAFGGVGFDYSVAAVKVGLFGQVSVDAQFAFLNQPYISKKAKTGQKLTIQGEAGIEFVAKYMFVSYEKVFASKKFKIAEKEYGEWKKIHDTWEDIKKGSSGYGGVLSTPEFMLSDGTIMYTADSRAVLEKRDYLDEFDRTWSEPSKIRLFSLDPVSRVKDLETNSYPYSNPVLTEDGQIMLYVSDAGSKDVDKTEVRWTRLIGDSYPDGAAIEPGSSSHGDSQLKLSGDAKYAAAVWVKQSDGIKKEAGAPISNSDVTLMSNSTEIMAAVYNGATWSVSQLTNNFSPDMAPVVATNGKSIIVAWRSMYASDSANPTNFTGNDKILYRIFNGTAWSEPQTLYNGTSGAVKGIEAAMLEDGTAAVTYTIDTTGIEPTTPGTGSLMNSGLETVFAIVDNSGAAVKNIRMTNDTYLDENPQIATVSFEDAERFVLGWYSVHDADGALINDIRLCSFDKNGTLYDKFIDSISSVNAGSQLNISRKFRFAKNAETIEDLSILWAQTQEAGIAEDDKIVADKDLLKAVKFMKDSNGRIYITSQLDVAEMGDFTLIDHFDAYMSDDNTVKAVILGSDYDGNGYNTTIIKVEEDGEIVDQIISTPKAVSGLYTAEGTYENKIELPAVAVDYNSIISGMQIPVQFTLFNAGVKPIDSISIEVDGIVTKYDKEFLLLPNSSTILTAYYNIPTDMVVNPEYKLTASFVNGKDSLLAEADTKSGRLYLDTPDTGISRFESLSEEQGKRLMQVTVYNNSHAKLEGTGRKVKIGFYSDADCTELIKEVAGQDKGQPYTVESADLVMIDGGAYTKQFTFDIGAYVGTGKEIPEHGVRIYARTWVEEPVDSMAPEGETDTIIEYYQNNNYSSLLFESLLSTQETPVTISTEQINESGKTSTVVTVRNNSLVDASSGNIIVSLLGSNGNVLETQQCFDKGLANNGLIRLGGEEAVKRTFNFSKIGDRVEVAYSNAVLTNTDNANLSSLSMTGIPFELTDGQTRYTLNTKELSETFISAVTEDPNSTVTINGKSVEVGQGKAPLYIGKNTIEVKVTAADGKTVKAYVITINNSKISTPDISNGDNNSTKENSSPSRPRVTAVDGIAVISLSEADVRELLENLNSGESRNIVITPVIEGFADEVILELPMTALKQIRAAKAEIAINTQLMRLSLNSTLLEEFAGKSGSMGAITFGIRKSTRDYFTELLVDGKAPGKLGRGLTAYLPLKASTSGTVAAQVKKDGSIEVIKLSFEKDGELIVPLEAASTFRIIDNSKKFNDVDLHWSREAVEFVTARELFSGTGQNSFSPNSGMTRGMLVTVLGRLSGVEAGDIKSKQFMDVRPKSYYTPFVEWAVSNGIAAGTGNHSFSPDSMVTREQLAVIINNFVKYMGFSINETGDGDLIFSDYNKISSYARDGVSMMNKLGIMEGKGNGIFDPKGKAKRGEVAALLRKLICSINR